MKKSMIQAAKKKKKVFCDMLLVSLSVYSSLVRSCCMSPSRVRLNWTSTHSQVFLFVWFFFASVACRPLKDSIHRWILQLSLVELANKKTHTLTLNTDNSLISRSSRLRLRPVTTKGAAFNWFLVWNVYCCRLYPSNWRNEDTELWTNIPLRMSQLRYYGFLVFNSLLKIVPSLIWRIL